MPLMHVQEIRFYDVFTDGEAIRLSGFDGRGGEFFCKMPLTRSGKSRRAQKAEALEAIEEAIQMADRGELQPGEVIFQ